MAVSLAGQLVVAISSRALFDFEEENEHFEANDDRAYMQLQLERIDQAAKPGVAFSLVKKLLAFNDASAQRVEVVILSRNDPVVVAVVGFLVAVLYVTGQTLQVFYQIPFTMVQLIQAIIVIAVASSEFFIRHRIRWTR